MNDAVKFALDNAADNLEMGNIKGAILSLDVVDKLTNDAPVDASRIMQLLSTIS